jgi:hypothetical protein
MNKRKISWLAAALTVPALVFGAMASTASAEPGLDPRNADNLAHIVILDDSVLGDLGGGNWNTTSDEWTDSELPKTAACDNTIAKLNALEKSVAGDRAGRAKNVMEQAPEGAEFFKMVESEVVVFKTAAPAAAALKEFKSVFTSGADDLTKCMVSQLDRLLSGIQGAKVTHYIPTKADDPAAGFAAEFTASQLTSPIRFETYVMAEGNTLVLFSMVGPKATISKANVEFLVDVQVESVKLVAGY